MIVFAVIGALIVIVVKGLGVVIKLAQLHGCYIIMVSEADFVYGVYPAKILVKVKVYVPTCTRLTSYILRSN